MNIFPFLILISLNFYCDLRVFNLFLENRMILDFFAMYLIAENVRVRL